MKLIRSIVPYIHPLLWSTERQLKKSVWDRIFYSAAYKFIYFRVPKSANSTVAISLARCMGQDADSGDRTGARSKNIGKQFLYSGVLFESQLERYFNFTFVRDPFARTLSAYLDKVATAQLKFRTDLGMDERPVSFLDFLRRLEDGFLMANIHWAPQYAIVPVPRSRLDFVGKVENLEADLAEVLRAIFGPGQHQIVSRTFGATSSAKRLSEFYGATETRLVRKLYERDFELFYPEVEDPRAVGYVQNPH